MRMFEHKKTAHIILTSVIGFGLALSCSVALASNFQSFSGINYSNPADLVYIVKSMQFIAGDMLVSPAITFNGTVTVPNPVPPLGGPVSVTGSSSNYGNLYMPYGRIASRLNEQWVFGVDVTQPFREDISYSSSSAVRYSSTITQVNSYDVAPSLAYHFGGSLSKWAFGFGFDALYMSSTLDQQYPSLPSISPLTPFGAGNDVSLTNYGNDWAYGWHAGLNYHPFRGTFLGLSYFSSITPKLTGTSTFSGYMNNPNLTSTSTLPATSNFTITQYLSERLMMQARVFYTQWSSIQDIVLLNTAGPASTAIIPMNYRNTWRVELRSRYDVTPKTALQGLLGYDETPINDVDRSTRLPETNKYIAGAGIEYKITPVAGLMFNYAHSFSIGTPTINNTDPNTGTVTSGTTDVAAGNLYELRLTVNV